MKSANKRQKNPNFTPAIGASTQFSDTVQPSSESKKSGWARRKHGAELVRLILDRKYIGKQDGVLRKAVAEYFQVDEKEITVEQIMIFRQAEKAIAESDTAAFKAVIERAFGAPKQETELTLSVPQLISNITPAKGLPPVSEQAKLLDNE